MLEYYGLMLLKGRFFMNYTYNVINCQCTNCGDETDVKFVHSKNTIKETYTLYLITSGNGIAVVDENRYFLEEGMSLISFPFSDLSIISEKKTPIKFKWIEFKGSEAAWIISQSSFSKINPITLSPKITDFEKYFDIAECHKKELFARCRASGKLIELLSFYIQFSPNVNDNTESYVVSARNYIDKNYRESDFSVQSVADHIKIDRTYLYRLFKKETGLSVKDYINNCRISKAEELLANPSIPIKDVAYSVGFSDQMYFSRTFKKFTGVTPTDFRKETINN